MMNELTRWQRPGFLGFSRANSFRDELEALFGTSLAAFAQLGEGSAPALDLFEGKEHFVVTAELPGLNREDIQVSFHEGNLHISGERKAEEKQKDAQVYRNERYFGRFERVVTLPTAVVADKVSAEYRDGVLTVTLPKAEEAKPKQINVNVN